MRNLERLSRRELLKEFGRVGVCLPLYRPGAFLLARPFQESTAPSVAVQSPAGPAKPALSESDDAFLEELERANFLYFWEQANPDTGLVRDRCNVRAPDNKVLGSIAATGFGLTALCIGEKREYISYAQARDRVLATLRFLWKKLPQPARLFLSLGEYQ